MTDARTRSPWAVGAVTAAAVPVLLLASGCEEQSGERSCAAPPSGETDASSTPTSCSDTGTGY